LAHDGELELAHDFAVWWLERTGRRISPLHVGPGSTFDEAAALDDLPYSLDELGIDQEELADLWP
jgi:hypothetical protein